MTIHPNEWYDIILEITNTTPVFSGRRPVWHSTFPPRTGGMDRSQPETLFSALQVLLNTFPDMIFVKNMDLRYVAGTQSFAEMLGKTSMEEVLGRTDYELFENKELSLRYTADDRKLLASQQDLVDYMEPLTDANGEARYSSTSKYILKDQDGAPLGLLGVSRDITREVKASRQYQQEIEYLFTLPPDAYAAIFIDVTDWRIIGQRRQADAQQNIPLYDSMESLLQAVKTGIPDENSAAYQVYQQFSPAFLSDFYQQGKRDLNLEYQTQFRDGSLHWIRDEWKFLSDPQSGHLTLMVLVRDIQSRKHSEEQLVQAAATDPMTGLLNRGAAVDAIHDFLSGPGAEGFHAVYMIDLDDFKAVNDTYGHQEGDTLLVQLADGIRRCFRESDVLGRIGGDEFLVLAKHVGSVAAAEALAERLLREVRDIHATSTAALASVSVGVSLYPEDGRTLEDLYAQADAALYKAKGMGKDQAAFASGEQSLWSSTAFAKRYEAYNSQVVEHSNSICYISDLETYELLHLTKAGMDLYGMTKPEDYLGKKCYQVIMGLDEPCPFCTNNKIKEGESYRWERYNENIGKWFDRTSSIIYLDGRPRHLEIGRDITARRQELSPLSGQLSMEDVLFRCLRTLTQEKDMATAVNLFLEGVGGYHQANRAYIFEFDLGRQVLNNTFEWCAPGVSAEIDNLQELPLELVDGWLRKFQSDGEFFISSLDEDVDPDSEEYRILEMQGIQSLMAAPLFRDEVIVGFLGVDDPRRNQGNLTLLRSVSDFVQAELERRRLQDELEHMSFTDTLTGLGNRNLYSRVLREYDTRTPDSLGVIFVDINGMKTINDAHGQSYGDHIIRKTGRIFSESVTGAIFRTGGDEFVALIENLSREDFQAQALALRAAFEQEPECTVSIGCAWREQEENTHSILLQAGELLAADKHAYYLTALKEGRRLDSSGISSEVLQEIEDGRFVVYYQPQVNIQTGRIIGAEALVRKKAEDGSLIPPTKFIPLYELEGVIGYVDLFVLESSCIRMKQWLEQGYDIHLSVNFSRITLLEPDIVNTITQLCQKHGIATSSITIEVTESISKMDHQQLKELIDAINQAGFTISLDDFGSQYSNLAILSAMDFDEIKFDRSLVETLEHNYKSQVVMENSVRMCRALEGTVSLAEGIETKGQLELLSDYQCDHGQGYFFSKPIPAEDFQRLLEADNP